VVGEEDALVGVVWGGHGAEGRDVGSGQDWGPGGPEAISMRAGCAGRMPADGRGAVRSGPARASRRFLGGAAADAASQSVLKAGSRNPEIGNRRGDAEIDRASGRF